MQFDSVPYLEINNSQHLSTLLSALLTNGIVGINSIPHYEFLLQQYIKAARDFALLSADIKNQYAPKDQQSIMGYELGAEKFQDDNGSWKIDDRKSSYYASITNEIFNQWPKELDLKTPYLALANLIFKIGKQILQIIDVYYQLNLNVDQCTGVARMLHYQQTANKNFNRQNNKNANVQWCGAHFDHGIFTGLIPAFYFQNGMEISEPDDSGLYIIPTSSKDFKKIPADNKSVLLFQVGEFGQIISDDKIRATKHHVKASSLATERFSMAVFFMPDAANKVNSKSMLIEDSRYANNKMHDGSIYYKDWHDASLARYKVKA